MTLPPTNTIEDRFWSKVRKDDGCWEWTASVNRRCYGWFHFGGKVERKALKAHRVSWELHNGPIPEGLWVLHKCDNPRCVRPDHLFLGDRTDNMRDCAAKGRVTNIGKALLTHCKRGHAFTPENTKRNMAGHRICVECDKDRRFASRPARAQQAKAYRFRAAAIRRAE